MHFQKKLFKLSLDTPHTVCSPIFIFLTNTTVSFDDLITNLDSANGKKVSKLALRVRFQSIVQHERVSRQLFRQTI